MDARMSRALPEWFGKTPNTPAPARVRIRIFERCEGKCHISGRKIAPGEPWELDHNMAQCAYQLADAMLEARKARPK